MRSRLTAPVRASVAFVALVLPPAVLRAQGGADVLCLRDTSVVRGAIVDSSKNAANVTLRTPDGIEHAYPRSAIKQMVRVGTDTLASDYMLCWRKSPAGSWLSSFVIPGWGQIGNKDWGKAGALATLWAVGWALYRSNDDQCHSHDRRCTAREIGRFLVLGTWIGAQIDAPLRAVAINRRNGEAREFRDGGLAFVLSWLLPGAGQAYNGDWTKAGLFAAAHGAGWGVYLGNAKACEDRDERCGLQTWGGILLIATYISASTEAGIRAAAINRGRGLAFELGPQPHSLGLSVVSLRF